MNSYDIHMILKFSKSGRKDERTEGRMEVTQREFLLPTLNPGSPVSQHRILRRHHLPSCPCTRLTRPSDQVACRNNIKEKMTHSNQTIKQSNNQSDHVALRGKKKRIGPNWLNLPIYEPRERSTAEQKTQRHITKGVFTIVNSHDSTQD